jgi:hypothetical protein
MRFVPDQEYLVRVYSMVTEGGDKAMRNTHLRRLDLWNRSQGVDNYLE